MSTTAEGPLTEIRKLLENGVSWRIWFKIESGRAANCEMACVRKDFLQSGDDLLCVIITPCSPLV